MQVGNLQHGPCAFYLLAWKHFVVTAGEAGTEHFLPSTMLSRASGMQAAWNVDETRSTVSVGKTVVKWRNNFFCASNSKGLSVCQAGHQWVICFSLSPRSGLVFFSLSNYLSVHSVLNTSPAWMLVWSSGAGKNLPCRADPLGCLSLLAGLSPGSGLGVLKQDPSRETALLVHSSSCCSQECLVSMVKGTWAWC